MGQITSLALQPIQRPSEEPESPLVNRTALRFTSQKMEKKRSKSKSKSRSSTPKPIPNSTDQTINPSNQVEIKKEQLEETSRKDTEGKNSKSPEKKVDEDTVMTTTTLGTDASKEDMELEAELNASLGMVPEGEESGNGDLVEKENSSNKHEENGKKSTTRRQSASNASGKDAKVDESEDDDNDSLFGGGDEDDAEGEEDVDAEGDDDDVPLSQSTNVDLENKTKGDSLALPGLSIGSNGAADGPKASTNGKKENGTKTSKASSSTTTKSNLKSQPIISSFDSDLKTFSNDVLLTSTLTGQVILYDRRVKPTLIGTGDGSSSQVKGVRSLPLPSKTPPWCQKACWSPNGDKIFVGRRNESVDEWDLRMIPDNDDSNQFVRSNPKMLRSLKLPSGSGPVSSVAAMPNGRHVLW